nr:adenylate kinase 8-like [Onthophagus taurus]
MDEKRLKLNLPPWHVPYLEKHRIMELFHELTRELIIQQPVDHLLFIKQILYRAAASVGISRVIILDSPKVNTAEVALQIAQQTTHHVITEDMLLKTCGVASRNDLKPGALAVCLSYMLHMEEPQNHGWILVGCIKTAAEAQKILQTGIVPTHVIHLIPPFMPKLDELLYCNVHAYWPGYRREIMAIRELFKTKLTEIYLRQRFIHEVVKECIDVIKILKSIGCPKQIRCVILGPRGSGRKTQAKLLVQKFNFVHIDFPKLLCQQWNLQNKFGETLRAQKDELCFRSDLMAQVLNKRILEDDCVNQGWVLTGFPFNTTDFKYIDTLDTPPNR